MVFTLYFGFEVIMIEEWMNLSLNGNMLRDVYWICSLCFLGDDRVRASTCNGRVI